MRNHQATTRSFTTSELTLLGAVLLYIVVMATFFRTFFIDNSWFGSFSYNYVHSGIVTDTMMNMRFPNGMGGVEAFGKLPALIQGAVAHLFGWQLFPLRMLSTVFVCVSVALFADTCRHLREPPGVTLCALAVFGFFEPCLEVASTLRYEFLTVFLLMLALWCFSRGLIFGSALAAGLSVGSEPIALAAFLVIAQTLLLTAPAGHRLRRLRSIATAFLCSVLVYLSFYPHILATLRHGDWHSMASAQLFGGFAAAYIRYRRHWIEDVFLLCGLVAALLWRRRVLMEWPTAAIALLLVLSVVLRWGNPHYWALVMPFAALFLAKALGADRHWRPLLAVLFLGTVPLQVYRFALSRDNAPQLTTADQRAVAAVIASSAAATGKSVESLNIAGDMYLFFAHPDRFRGLDMRIMPFGSPITGDLLLCPEQRLERTPRDTSSEWKCSELSGIPEDAQRVTVHGYTFRVVPLAGLTVTPRMPPANIPLFQTNPLPPAGAP